MSIIKVVSIGSRVQGLDSSMIGIVCLIRLDSSMLRLMFMEDDCIISKWIIRYLNDD